MVVANYKATPVPLPSTIELSDINHEVSPSLRAKVDAVYHTKEITVVITFKHSEDNMVTLLAIARRCWEVPTLDYERAFEQGLSYKGFELNLAIASSTPSMGANARFDNVCEILHIAVTNLQMKKLVKSADNGYWWCDWILSLPAIY